MKLFGRTSGYYLFWTGVIYFTVGMALAFSSYREYTSIIAPIWIFVLMLPFIIPPFGRWLNLDVKWDKDMFGWRKRQIAEQVNKDIGNLPEAVETTEVPVVKEPEDKFDATESTYTIGKNKSGNTQLRMKLDYGSATLTMAPEAVVELIEQLAVTIRKQYDVEVTQLVQDATEEDNANVQ